MQVVGSSGVSTDENEISQIAQFYDGKSVFITGGAGFVGAVLLETLLRCCPGIKHVYLLLREKKGVPPEIRREQVFNKRIFSKLKKEKSDAFDKVQVVPGDITLPNLGIEQPQMENLIEDVSIVFHCAAVISFMKPLGYMIYQNSCGTANVVKLCQILPKLVAFVHTSTAYSNCNRSTEIEEIVYKLSVPVSDILDAAASRDEEALSQMASQCVPPWPNTYTFSKAVAEEVIAAQGSNLPVAIVRPSVIISTWKGVLPGYTEEGAGVIDVSIGIGKGFIRVLYCDEDKIVDIIPADVVVNTLITAAWSIGTNRCESPLVVNCTSGQMSPCRWGHFINTLYHMQEIYPLPKMYQKPFLVMRKHRVTYWASAIVNHYAPAICIDIMLMLMKKKPKLTKLYRFYDVALNYLSFFLTNEWRFCCENYKTLIKQQNTKDAQNFPVSIKGFTVETIAWNLKHGAPFYQWETDKRKFHDRIPIAYRRYVLTTFIKWMAILWFVIFFGIIIAKSFQGSYVTVL